MADSKKYNGSTWEHSLRKLTTATDTFTTLPVDIYADGTNATVGISGNTVQSGTPTPDNPIMPQGCGNMTGNLVEKRIDGCNISSSGVLNSNASWNVFVAKIEQGKTYSVDTPTYAAFYELTPIIGSSSYDGQRYSIESSFTSPIDGYVAFRKMTSELTAMCNEGSTPLPYEPYGQYKIPISSASTTTPVYLGEAQTTRLIKKLVLTGEENWNYRTTSYGYCYALINSTTFPINDSFCSHFKNSGYTGSSRSTGRESLGNEEFICVRTSSDIYFRYDSVSDTNDFQTYLQQQYTAGTPVTIWYVLATEETGIVNEPLMKIGEYADTLSNISIPVTAGGDTLSVDTTVQPSEVTVNYTGWHDAEVEEWDGSQWNE